MTEASVNGGVKIWKTQWASLTARGADARAWLNGLLTCNVEQVTHNQGAWGLLLNKRGKIICDLVLVSDADKVWIGTALNPRELFDLLDGYLVMEDAELALSPETAWLSLHGPGALEVAHRIVGAPAAKVDFGSEESAVLVVPEDRVEQTIATLERESGAALFDDSSWLSWRVQHGLPAFGIDFGSDDNPHQAALDRRTVDWSKGCYLGQEVVCMQDMRGKLKRRLARLSLAQGVPLEAGTAVVDAEGNRVGTVTSAHPGLHAKGAAAAIASLKAPYFEPGARVTVGNAAATVLDLLARGDD